MPSKKGAHNAGQQNAAQQTGSAMPPDAATLSNALNLQALGPGAINEMQQLFDVLLTGNPDAQSVRDVLGAADIDSEALREQLLRASSGTLERYIFGGGIDGEGLPGVPRAAGQGGARDARARTQQASAKLAAVLAATTTDPAQDLDQYLMDDIDEDAAQITTMVAKLEVLPQSILRKCVAPWRDPSTDNESPQQLCSNIVETVRYLAAVHLLTVADKFQCLPGAEDRINLINNMMMSLWEGIGLLQPKIRDHVALLLGVPVPASANDICVAVSGLGISTFFAALPLDDLRLVCDELKLLDPAPSTTDEDLLPEVYCQRLCSYFYPSLAMQPEAEKCCAVRTTVHENGPGSYTCTIDNACLLSMIGQRTHISNLFTCNKVKWRARVHVHMDSHLSFSVIQRQNPKVKATMVLRSMSESKAKKAANNAAGGQGQPLRLETTEECTKTKPISFNRIVSVMEVINSSGKAPKGLYNNAEDRLSFHFTLNCDVLEAGDDAGSQPSSPGADKRKEVKPEPKLKPGMTKAQRAAAERGEDPSLAGKKKEKDVADEEKRTPVSEVEVQLTGKKKKEFDKKRRAVEQSESSEREKISQSYHSAMASMHSESNKSRQHALQRQRDRERRQELAKAQPNQELQAQARKLQQDALQAKSALSKLNDERAGIDREAQKLQQQIANRRREIEACAERLAAAKAAIEAADRESEELKDERERVKEEVESALEAKKRASQFKEIVNFTAPAQQPQQTATISDFTSFWSGGGSAPGGAPSGASAAAGQVPASGAQPGSSSSRPQFNGSGGNGSSTNGAASAQPARGDRAMPMPNVFGQSDGHGFGSTSPAPQSAASSVGMGSFSSFGHGGPPPPHQYQHGGMRGGFGGGYGGDPSMMHGHGMQPHHSPGGAPHGMMGSPYGVPQHYGSGPKSWGSDY